MCFFRNVNMKWKCHITYRIYKVTKYVKNEYEQKKPHLQTTDHGIASKRHRTQTTTQTTTRQQEQQK